MLVFIDESGDAGLKLAAGSTPYLVVTLVLFEDHDEALSADNKIAKLRKHMGLREDFEFSFNSMSRKFREAFLNSLCDGGFFYFSIVINKAQCTGPGFKFKGSFYKYACSLVFENAKPHLDQAIVIIDGSGSREFRRQLGAYLRKKVNVTKGESRFIRKVKIQDSKKNNLLQLADVICGAVARSFGNKADARIYRELVAHREFHVQFWPKKE